MKAKVVIICISCLFVACASQPQPKVVSQKTKPSVVDRTARIYSLEAPVVPKPEVMDPQPATTQGPPVDPKSAAKFLLGTSLDGIPVSAADFRGKLLLINYWASWCPPCWAEMAQLEAIYADFQHRGVEIVAVNYGESDQAIENFLRRQKRPLTYLIATDPDTIHSHSQDVRAVPTTLLLDSRGNLIKRYVGLFGFDARQVRRDLKSALKSARR